MKKYQSMGAYQREQGGKFVEKHPYISAVLYGVIALALFCGGILQLIKGSTGGGIALVAVGAVLMLLVVGNTLSAARSRKNTPTDKT